MVSTAGESSQSKFGNSEWDTEGIATVLNTSGAFRMLTKARRELAFGRKGHSKSPSTAAFSTSCSLIVPLITYFATKLNSIRRVWAESGA